MEKLTIHTDTRYEVLFERGLLPRAGALTAMATRGRRALIVSDDAVASLYLSGVREAYQSAGFDTREFVFARGERSKSADTLFRLLNFAAESAFSRADVFVALGGGVVGDLTGLAASLYMRGVDYVQLPTTLLAMVDSSVGGKTAVNLNAGKNLCGTFYQPRLVLCDLCTLSTLPKEIYAEGMAEIVKYGAICAPDILNALAASADIAKIVCECVRIKGEIVARDERDADARQLLNFGHTFGHAVEHLSAYSLYHGEAVGIGMLIAAYASQRRGFCREPVYEEIKNLLSAQNLPCSTPFTAKAIASAAMRDKKIQGKRLILVLPLARGECVLHAIDTAALNDFIAPCEGVVTGV